MGRAKPNRFVCLLIEYQSTEYQPNRLSGLSHSLSPSAHFLSLLDIKSCRISRIVRSRQRSSDGTFHNDIGNEKLCRWCNRGPFRHQDFVPGRRQSARRSSPNRHPSYFQPNYEASCRRFTAANGIGIGDQGARGRFWSRSSVGSSRESGR